MGKHGQAPSKLNTLTLMNMVLPAATESKESALKIKGRTMLHKDFSSRLQNMCTTLGFENVEISESCKFGTLDSFSVPEQNCSGRDAVIVLSCKVHYNPNWGGFCGHPQLLARTQTVKDESCLAGFLAPFLRLYRLAQEQIYLTETKRGRYLITVPKRLLKDDEEKNRSTLTIALDKVAEPDENGAIVPVSGSGPRFSYTLSTNLRRTLDIQNYAWKPGRSMPIGRYLGSDMFFFTGVEQAPDNSNPFYATLFPYLRQLVTHRTPHLRAAEIHLRQEFCRAISILTAKRQAISPKLLCLVGLDIDMTPLAGHGEKYFVPWKAYLEGVNSNGSKRCSLDQDDLFERLIQ